jgi:hypothetical protein
MSSRNSAPLGSAVLPVYNALGGPQGKGHVTFNRAQSQYLDAGPRTLNIATNGGLTIVAVVRFTGTPSDLVDDPLIDLGPAHHPILVTRSESRRFLYFEIFNTNWNHDTRTWITSSSGEIVQNVWLTVVAR